MNLERSFDDRAAFEGLRRGDRVDDLGLALLETLRTAQSAAEKIIFVLVVDEADGTAPHAGFIERDVQRRRLQVFVAVGVEIEALFLGDAPAVREL